MYHPPLSSPPNHTCSCHAQCYPSTSFLLFLLPGHFHVHHMLHIISFILAYNVFHFQISPDFMLLSITLSVPKCRTLDPPQDSHFCCFSKSSILFFLAFILVTTAPYNSTGLMMVWYILLCCKRDRSQLLRYSVLILRQFCNV